jgi:hypothetical protein
MSTTTTGAEPRVFEKSGTIHITARTSAIVIPGGVLLAYVVAQPHYHLPAKHDDPIMLGSEVALVLAVLFVGWRLVGGRLLGGEKLTARPSA